MADVKGAGNILELRGISTVYGRNKMLADVSVVVPAGQCVCLLGSNGAGKSTLIKAILGLVKIVEGDVYYLGEKITGTNTHNVVRKGIGIVPEGRRIFPKLTVEENLKMGAFEEKSKQEIALRFETVFEHFPRLKERLSQLGGTLSGGEQAMLTIGRGLMGKPKLLIFDEPSLGLAPKLIQETFAIIRRINESGITIFLVEQNANMSLSIADYGYFLQKGEIIASGTSDELKKVDIIKEAYFK
jgi:branched-chain amino acid transport system ATP-binding protein